MTTSDDPLLIARELYHARHYAGVVAVCTQALEREPMDAELLLERACAWVALWRADQAYADLHEVLLLDPGCARAYRVLGHLLVQSGKLAGARDAFRRALGLCPEDREAQSSLEAVESRLAEVSRGRAAGRARASTAPLVRGEPERGARGGHRRAPTAPSGHAVTTLATLTTLLRRAPSGAPVHAAPRRRGEAAVEPARAREKTAPLRAPGHVRAPVATGTRAATSPGHAPARTSSPHLRGAPAGGRAGTAPITRVGARAITAPVARATASPGELAPQAAPANAGAVAAPAGRDQTAPLRLPRLGREGPHGRDE